MPKNTMIRMLSIALLSAGLGACVAPPGYYRGGYVYTNPPAGVAYFSYWYYPGAGVYYDIQHHVYFYPSNGGWVRVRQLPPPMKARLGDYVTIHSRHDRPYLDYNTHRREYPAYRYAPPAKKIPEQRRYQPQQDRYDMHRDNRRRDEPYYRQQYERTYRQQPAPSKHAPVKSSKDKTPAHGKGHDKSDKYDRERKDNNPRNSDRRDQNQQYLEPPRKD